MDDVLKIVCIHRELESDLELWNSLKRALSSAEGRYLLIVGSNERAARVSGCGEAVLKRPGMELIFSSERHRILFEAEIRTAGKKIIQNFTDAGIASVGVVGSDRGILKRDSSGNLRLSGIGSLIALTRSGVVSVLLTAGIDVAGKVIDINPFHVAVIIDKLLYENRGKTKGQIVLLISKPTDSLMEKMVAGTEIEMHEVLDLLDGLPEEVCELTVFHPNGIRLLTPLKLGKAPGARVNP